MKYTFTFVCIFMYATMCYSQISIYTDQKLPYKKQSDALDRTNELAHFRISGIGSASSNVNLNSISPSGSALFNFIGGKSRQMNFGIGVNFGRFVDSSYTSNLKLAELFNTDQSKSAFTAYASLDLLRQFEKLRKSTANLANIHEAKDADVDGIQWFSLSPTFEYSYQNREFVNIQTTTTPSINTTTSILGIKMWYRYQNGTNLLGFLFFPRYKLLAVVSNNLGTFKEIIGATESEKTPKLTSFFGLTTGILYNDVVISFDYDFSKPFQINNQNIGGSVFKLKAAFTLGGSVL